MRSLGFMGSGFRFGIAAALALLLTGCETQPPPSLANRAKATAAPSPLAAKSLEVVLAPKALPEMEFLKASARIQAGMDTARIQFAEAPEGGQAAAVREAIARKPPAIIVEAPATPDSELVKAAAEAKAKGIFVVVVGRPLGGEGESAKGTGGDVVVEPRPFAESAALLVKSAARNAENAKIDPKAAALIVSRPAADPLVADRIAILKKALTDFGVAEIDEVSFEGDMAAGKAAILDSLAAHPKVTLVLAADSVSLAAAQAAVKREHPFTIAGYSADESVVRSMIKTGEYAAVALFFTDRLVRKGINVAVHVLRGEKPADRVEVDTEVLSSSLQAGLPQGPPDDDSKKRKPFEAE